MRILGHQDDRRGDTIVEVMFAIAVFAFVAAGSLAVMRQGISTSMRSLEITQARQTINNQAELLRYIQQETLASDTSPYQTVWKTITGPSYAESQATPYGDYGGSCNPGARAKPFVIDPSQIDNPTTSTTLVAASSVGFPPTAPAYPKFADDGKAYEFWVESVPSPSSVSPKYVDFHIRACWNAPGNSAPMTLGTIVRLYEK